MIIQCINTLQRCPMASNCYHSIEVWMWKDDRTWTGDTISSSCAMRQMFRLGGTPAWLPYMDRLDLRPVPDDSWDWSNEIEWKVWNGAEQRRANHWGVAIRVPKTGPLSKLWSSSRRLNRLMQTDGLISCAGGKGVLCTLLSTRRKHEKFVTYRQEQ